jgi:NAD(P)-dependent dehydrogenase (short-subunit alcohol dehydrogenase family)
MKDFNGRIAVVTGGGTGMGRALVHQLAAEGCHVAMCDVNRDAMDESAKLAGEGAPAGTRITTHVCDVSDAVAMDRFRDEVVAEHETDHVNLVFNNAGIGGGGSFLTVAQSEWERTFGVCWGGVYNGCRAFVPLLVASDEGYLVNTSSVNGFWALLAPGIPHTAYSAAKFAVKGFSEALLEDFRLNAPHVKVAVVMPGHIGTDIAMNTLLAHSETTVDPELARMFGQGFRDSAPMTADQAATVILDGVRTEQWRILVGDDAQALDEAVRANPLAAYGPDGFSLATLTGRARRTPTEP